ERRPRLRTNPRIGGGHILYTSTNADACPAGCLILFDDDRKVHLVVDSSPGISKTPRHARLRNAPPKSAARGSSEALCSSIANAPRFPRLLRSTFANGG